MEKDLSKDKRFITDTPKEFSLGEVNLNNSSDKTKKSDGLVSNTSTLNSSKIQKALLVVDDLRSRTLNTLDTLKQLSKEDSLKVRFIEQKLNDLKANSDTILDPKNSGTEDDAKLYLKSLSDVKTLLKDYKNTIVSGQTLEEFLNKSSQESNRRLLLEKEIVKVLSDASKTLGTPFSTFLKNNITNLSSDPVQKDLSNVGFGVLGGPLAPFLSLVRDFVPEVLSTVDSVKDNFKLLKEAFSDKEDKKSASEVLSENIDVNKQLDTLNPLDSKRDDKNLKSISVGIKKLVKTSEEEAEDNELESTESQKFKDVVLDDLKSIRESSDDIAKKDKDGGLLSNLTGGLGSVMNLGRFLLKGGLISSLGVALSKVFTSIGPKLGEILKGSIGTVFSTLGPKLTELGSVLARSIGLVLANPATWVAAGTALAGYISFEIGKYFGTKKANEEDRQQAAFENIVRPNGYKLPENLEKSLLESNGNKSSTATTPEVSDPKAIPQSVRPPIERSTIESKSINVNKIAPQAEKPVDVNAIVSGFAQTLQKLIESSGSGVTRSVERPRKGEELPFITKDTGLILLNHGVL